MDTDYPCNAAMASPCLVCRFADSMIAKIAVFSLLLVVLAGIVWTVPVLWELAVAGVIGAVYWIFFRIPPNKD
ncbi:MAG: hypothetical protein Q8N89_09160 [Azonexus sp.]|nr:hypothetical protein [Azonexus sp.]